MISYVNTVENMRNSNDNGTCKVSKQHKSIEAKQKKSPSKSSPSKLLPTKEELFDTSIPIIKLPTNISRTFPKVSPSRKIQNINIVFPPSPPINVSDEVRNNIVTDSKYIASVLKKEPIDVKEKEKYKSKTDERKQQTPTKKKRQENFQPPRMAKTMESVRTPNVEESLKVRVTSTPKYTPVKLFSSTVIEEEVPKTKKVLSQSILEISSIFEGNCRSDNCAEKSLENAAKPKKLSQSLLEKTWIFESSSTFEELSDSKSEKPRKAIDHQSHLLLERNVRSTDPVLFEENDRAAVSTSMSVSVRDIVNRLEVSTGPSDDSEKRLNRNGKKEKIPLREEESNIDPKSRTVRPTTSILAVAGQERTKFETQSPCTRFLCSRRKSTELENVIRSKQSAARENTVVQGIIETLVQKVNKSSSRQKKIMGVNQNFVKKLVDALEKGKTLDVDVSTMKKEEDIGSGSESEGKSCETTTSLKDTDSNSDSDHRPGELRSDEHDRTFDSEGSMIRKLSEEEDSVYWIPVSRCKLPRTSSLLSMMSKLSTHGQSPCVSPIRSDNEADTSQTVAWDGTFRKTNVLPRKLFRIDETTVIDSGYSDKSDRSGTSGSMTDSTWSEDTQDICNLENNSSKWNKSSRRKSIIGLTFRVSC